MAIEGFRETLRREAHRAIVWGVCQVLRPGAVLDPKNFERFQKVRINVQALGFYASFGPLDEADLENKFRGTPGLDFNYPIQLNYLKMFSQFNDEFAKLPLNQQSKDRFFQNNGAFESVDARAYWGMIRHHQPSTIIEVGVGNSTLLAAEAVRRNGTGKVIAIDPYQEIVPINNSLGIEIVKQKAEDLDPRFFSCLDKNDILFVDNSHVLRPGGDVDHMITAVMPTLRPGVLAHFHDIYLPGNYPAELSQKRLVFWNEAQMLQAYLCENPKVEILFNSQTVLRHFPDRVWQAFPDSHKYTGASFWVRRVAPTL